MRRLAFLVHQRQELRHADRTGDEEQTVPAPVDPDDRGAEEDERHEARSSGRRRIVDQREDRHEHRADEAEGRHDLRRPVERQRDSDGGDSRCQCQSHERRHQLIASGGKEQRRVAAGDAGADRGDRRVEPSVTSVREHAGGEEECRRDRAEHNPLDGADPAVARGQSEEEDDAEQRHDAAGEREPARPQQVRRLEPGHHHLAAEEGRLARLRRQGGPACRRRARDGDRCARGAWVAPREVVSPGAFLRASARRGDRASPG